MKIAPSILSSDFAALGEQVSQITQAGADYIHVDVMDGVFVKNITMGPPIIKAIRPYSSCPFDVHLMITQPSRYIEEFVMAGADLLTIHVEAEQDVLGTLRQIKAHKKKVGLALRPNTSVEEIFDYLQFVDLILIMTVEPGFGGQEFIFDMVKKISALKRVIKAHNLNTLIEVDGGINATTAKLCANAGADVCVAGSYIFARSDFKQAINTLRSV